MGWACVAHLSFCFDETVYRTFHGASYQVLVHLAKRFHQRRFFLEITNQKQKLSMVAMFVNAWGRNAHRGPSIDASYQVSVHLAKLEINQSETRIACGGHVC